jgi:hypothetical protein
MSQRVLRRMMKRNDGTGGENNRQSKRTGDLISDTAEKTQSEIRVNSRASSMSEAFSVVIDNNNRMRSTGTGRGIIVYLMTLC